MAAPIGHSQLTGSTVPQHATFAHSKEDVLNALAFYFGRPVSPEKLKDYNEHHAATYHFPDAYAGSNTQIRDTINNLVEKSPQNWHTTIGLPFRRIEGTTVEWDEIRFDVRLMQRVPVRIRFPNTRPENRHQGLQIAHSVPACVANRSTRAFLV